MKFEMNQNVLIALMLSVLLIMSIFVVGKLLGYGNTFLAYEGMQTDMDHDDDYDEVNYDYDEDNDDNEVNDDDYFDVGGINEGYEANKVNKMFSNGKLSTKNDVMNLLDNDNKLIDFVEGIKNRKQLDSIIRKISNKYNIPKKDLIKIRKRYNKIEGFTGEDTSKEDTLKEDKTIKAFDITNSSYGIV